MRHLIKKNWRRILVALILLAIGLYSGVSLVQYAIRSVSTWHTNQQLQTLFDAAEESPDAETIAQEPAATPDSAPEMELLDCYQYISEAVLPEAKEMLEINPDTVAWLRIPGGVVDLPVVYRDNTYYLDHDFYGKRSIGGALFLDEKHPLLHDTQYMVIHGHDMYDGSMFGRLSNYRKQGYMEKHPTVYLNTLYRKEEYEVIGVLFVPGDVQSEGFVPYNGIRKFQSLDHFYGFVDLLRENALHWKEGTEILPSDALLALSTCLDENRIVVICRRTSPQ